MKKKIITVLGSLFLILNICAVAHAETQTMFLPHGQIWIDQTTTLNRSLDYSYVYSQCLSVYPISGKDNFEKIQTRVQTEDGTNIGEKSYTVLTEGKSASKIKIKDGKLKTRKVKVAFRGNNPDYKAMTTVNYYTD